MDNDKSRSSCVDIEIQEMVNRKCDLLVKKHDGELSEPEEHELKILSNKLEDMTFSRNIPTIPYFDEFVVAMHKIYRNRSQVKLSPKEIDERNAKAEEILRELMGADIT